jgi:hypothetical protein
MKPHLISLTALALTAGCGGSDYEDEDPTTTTVEQPSTTTETPQVDLQLEYLNSLEAESVAEYGYYRDGDDYVFVYDLPEDVEAPKAVHVISHIEGLPTPENKLESSDVDVWSLRVPATAVETGDESERWFDFVDGDGVPLPIGHSVENIYQPPPPPEDSGPMLRFSARTRLTFGGRG